MLENLVGAHLGPRAGWAIVGRACLRPATGWKRWRIPGRQLGFLLAGSGNLKKGRDGGDKIIEVPLGVVAKNAESASGLELSEFCYRKC